MKKKALSLLLTLAMLLSLVPAFGTAASADATAHWTAENSEANPYLLHSYADLATLAGDVNGGTTYSGKYFKLADDFPTDSSSVATPIGKDYTNSFRGTFDGNWKTVSLNISSNGTNQYYGLFGYLYNGTVKNLFVSGAVTSTVNTSYAGGVVGYMWGGSIINCGSTATISANASESCYAGGIVGDIAASGTVTNCYARGNISSSGMMSHSGGVSGSQGYGVTISNSYATGNISTSGYSSEAGGVTGNNSYSTVNCYSTCGSTSYANGTVLTAAEMTAASGEDALITKLNAYATTNSLNAWTINSNQNDGYPTFALPVSYRYPVYNTVGDPTSGIKEWKTASTTNYIEVVGSEQAQTWITGFYYVTGADVKITATVTVSGDVALILADGAKLTVEAPSSSGNAGIYVPTGESFTVYGQTGDTGTLIATGNGYSSNDPLCTCSGAGIGGNDDKSSGAITINGGKVTANGGKSSSDDHDGGAGIGGGRNAAGSNITINGGTVTANGGYRSAGIGGGTNGAGSYITINGGTVTATGGAGDGCCGAGIGSGSYYGDDVSASNITIAESLIVKADRYQENPTDTIASGSIGTTFNVAASSAKRYVTIAPPPTPVTLQVNSGTANDDATRAANAAYQTIAGALAKAENGDTIKLASDVTENVTIASGKKITLDLNGFVLKGAVTTPTSTQSGSVITNNGTLYINDSDTSKVRYFTDNSSPKDGSFETYTTTKPSGVEGVDYITVTGGCITGGTGTDNSYKGGGVFNTGALTLQGGNIIGNTTDGSGGGVYVNNSTTFTMTGGTISGNSSCSGGGVDNNGSFTMTGGMVADNTADYHGGVDNNGSFTMTGGEISGNRFKESVGSGGVYNNSGKTATVGGTAQITGNTVNGTARNLVLFASTATLDTPATGMSIGVTLLDGEMKPTTGAFTTNGSTNELPYFFSDNDAYGIKFVTDHLELITVQNAVSLTADAKIGINFYLDVEAYLGATPSGTVELTYNHNRTTYGTNLTTDTIPVAASQKQGEGKTMEGSYLYTAYVAPDQMMDDVTLKLKDGSGNVVYTKTYSVAEYCQSVSEHITDTTFTDKLKNLCNAMLDYGSAAQTNFGYNKSNLANGGTWKDSTLTSVDTSGLSNYKFGNYSAHAGELDHGELVFYDGMELRAYVSDSANLTDATEITVTCDSDSQLEGRFGQRVGTNGKRYIYIKDISPIALANNYNISFGGSDRFLVSALGFAKMNMGSVSTTEKLLLQAMVKYQEKADAYFGPQ